MLLRRAKPDNSTRFIWSLPVYAVGCLGKPSGWVWGERVAVEAWECWGAGGRTYTRLPLAKRDDFGYRQTWRPPTLATDPPRIKEK